MLESLGVVGQRLGLTFILRRLFINYAHSLRMVFSTCWLCSPSFLTTWVRVAVVTCWSWFPNYITHGFLGPLSLIVFRFVRLLCFPGLVPLPFPFGVKTKGVRGGDMGAGFFEHINFFYFASLHSLWVRSRSDLPKELPTIDSTTSSF